MKKNITLIFLLFSFYAESQVFPGPGGAIQNDGQETYVNLPISGLAQSQLSNTFGIEEVCINITHPTVEELYIYLESPSGTRVELTEGSSCKGVNYAGTCFNNTSSTSITLGTAPYAGNYRPFGFLGRFNNGQASNGTWKLIVKDYLAFVNTGTVVSWSIKFSSSPVQSLSFTSSNLPIVVINTNGQPLSDIKIKADMGIIYNGTGVRNNLTDAMNNYNGKTKIRFRGNSSRYFEKKPFSLELCDAAGADLLVSLLGMPAESEWTLIAMYQDKSLIRIPLTYDIARQMGNYAARLKMVEVVLNNEYYGVYAFMEKLKRDENRINVSKLSELENVAPAVTGGYIVKIDRTDEPGWYSLLAGDAANSAHFFYQYVYPKDSDITIPQSNYIQSFVDSFETAMSAPNYADPWVGYPKYINVESFVDYFLINELSKNVDAYRLSTYLYKEKINKGGKMSIGPVWDYDLAWHNCNYSNSFDPTGWQYQLTDTTHPTPLWWTRFMQDTNFVNKVYCRWTQLRQNILSNAHLLSYVDSSALGLNESHQRNFIQWPILGAYINPNPQNQAGAGYQSEVTDLKNWITARTVWMDWAITGICIPAGTSENSSNNKPVVYPNPSKGIFTIQSSVPIGNTPMVEIYNMVGEKVYSSPMNQTLIIDFSTRPDGVYFYQLKGSGSTQTGKIIINN